MTAGDPLGNGHSKEFDITRPNVARVYDALLGGKDNFAADRAFVDETIAVAPKAPLSARANRAFLGRVVRYLIEEAGITQFLDIGSGLPTQGNVSEVAHEISPEARILGYIPEPEIHNSFSGGVARKP